MGKSEPHGLENHFSVHSMSAPTRFVQALVILQSSVLHLAGSPLRSQLLLHPPSRRYHVLVILVALETLSASLVAHSWPQSIHQAIHFPAMDAFMALLDAVGVLPQSPQVLCHLIPCLWPCDHQHPLESLNISRPAGMSSSAGSSSIICLNCLTFMMIYTSTPTSCSICTSLYA